MSPAIPNLIPRAPGQHCKPVYPRRSLSALARSRRFVPSRSRRLATTKSLVALASGTDVKRRQGERHRCCANIELVPERVADSPLAAGPPSASARKSLSPASYGEPSASAKTEASGGGGSLQAEVGLSGTTLLD